MRRCWLIILLIGVLMANNSLQALWDFLMPSAYADAASISDKGMAYVESRGASRKKLETEGAAGELGKYQMTPPAWNDLVRLMPKYRNLDRRTTLINDSLAEKALRDYLNLLEHHYARLWKINPTDENLLQMYNLGPSGFRAGKRNPAYVATYQRGNR
jgi:hypothetical protein